MARNIWLAPSLSISGWLMRNRPSANTSRRPALTPTKFLLKGRVRSATPNSAVSRLSGIVITPPLQTRQRNPRAGKGTQRKSRVESRAASMTNRPPRAGCRGAVDKSVWAMAAGLTPATNQPATTSQTTLDRSRRRSPQTVQIADGIQPALDLPVFLFMARTAYSLPRSRPSALSGSAGRVTQSRSAGAPELLA